MDLEMWTLRPSHWKNKTIIVVYLAIIHIVISTGEVTSDSTNPSDEEINLTQNRNHHHHHHHSPRTSKSIIDQRYSRNHHRHQPPLHRHRRHHSKHSADPLLHRGGDDVKAAGCHGDEEVKMLLRHCYTSLRSVMVRYSKLLKEEENDTRVNTFNVCGNLDKVFSNCSNILTDDVTRQCLSRDRKLGTFKIIMEHFSDVCTNTGDLKRRKLALDMDSCFREEYRGTLSIRCDEHYEFNIHQGTMHDCHFQKERFKCLESLLDTSCGTSASTFTFHFLSIVYERLHFKSNCLVVRHDPNYAVFGYDHNGCKRGLIKRLEWCTSTHLDGSFILQFHPDNDLVAMGNSKNILKLCRAFARFAKCIQPIRETCPKAVSLFLQYESKLYQYILKMDFICSEQIIEAYSSNLKCLRSAVTDQHLDKCDSHWTELRPYLNQLTSVDFYCSPQKQEVMEMRNELSSLHACHKNVITDQCGSISGNIIVQFLQLALTDPLYLRFGYRPNCSLHGVATQRHRENEFDNLSVMNRQHLHLNHHPSYDDDDDVIATSGASEHDWGEAIATKSSSSPFDRHVTSPNGVGEGRTTGIIDQSIIDLSTGYRTDDYLETTTKEIRTEVTDEIYILRDKINQSLKSVDNNSNHNKNNDNSINNNLNNADRSIQVQYLIAFAVLFTSYLSTIVSLG